MFVGRGVRASVAWVAALACTMCSGAAAAPPGGDTPGGASDARGSTRVVTLAENGLARYVVHAGATDAVTRHAADEIADYLSRIAGAQFVVTEAEQASGKQSIDVGGDGGARRCRGTGAAPLGNDGFVICLSGRDLVIAGDTPRGTLFGAYWWLDRQLGVKWLAPDATELPTARMLRVAVPAVRQVPRFAYREVLSAEGEDKVYRAHNLLNGESHGTSFRPSPPGIDMWDRSWLAREGDFDFWTLVPRSRYAAAHPAWYAGGQLAMMSPDVRRAMAESIVERLRKRPDPGGIWFGIHDMDWGWDMDAASRAFADAHGGAPAAAFLDMVQDVSARVRQSIPDARFAMPAYHWGFAPPAGMKVPDNVRVYPMTIQVDYSTALNEGRNAALGDGLRRWNDIASHVLVWDHIVNFGGFIQPTPNLYPIGRSIAWLATLPSVEGYFAEGDWQSRGGEFSSLRVWMIARLLWSPDLDARDLVREYCDAYFGAAGPAIARYIDRMHAAARASGDVLGEQTPVGASMYSYAFVREAERDFDAAQQAVAGDPKRLARVSQARIPLDFVILALRDRYAARARRDGWDLGIDARRARFDAAVAAAGIRQYRQSGNLAALGALLDVERRPGAPPAIVAGLPARDWRSIDTRQANLYDSARVIADPLAPDGSAISVRGDAMVWAVQLKLDKLPRDGKWDLFVAARVSDGAGAAPAGAVRVGAYPPMTLRRDTPARTLPRSGYQWLSVPGGPFAYGVDHEKGIYVHGVGLARGQNVLVGPFIAIRHGATSATEQETFEGSVQ
ncbi:Glycosyl hydrolase family 67 N-terminus [Burkholderia multivorans]